MDPAGHERTRAPFHGLVGVPLAVALLLLAALSLAGGLAGGLWRAGWAPADALAALAAPALLQHGTLMIGGFFGSVIGVERAVALKAALKQRWGFAAPALSAAGGVLLLAGAPGAGQALLLAAAVVFSAVSAALVRRQPAAHTVLLAVAALAWVGMGLARAAGAAAAAWMAGFGFLVVTVAAERLEMARLLRQRPGVRPALFAAVAALLAAAAWAAFDPAAGARLYGAALLALAAWLALFDIARRTVRAAGLARYMAVALLAGYAWLAVGGGAWLALAAGHGAARDAALHALGLGFVLSMVMAHAPVILPAVARVKVAFGPLFYAPLALLHASLAWRLLAPAALDGAALANVAALLAFAAVVAAGARRWRRDRSA